MTETDLTLLELEREFVGEMGRMEEDEGSEELRLWSESNLEKGSVGREIFLGTVYLCLQ